MIPAGGLGQASDTCSCPLKPPAEFTVKLKEAEPPTATVADVGRAMDPVTPGGEAMSWAEALCIRAPLIPATEKLYVPGATFCILITSEAEGLLEEID